MVPLLLFIAGCFPVDPCLSRLSIFQALDDDMLVVVHHLPAHLCSKRSGGGRGGSIDTIHAFVDNAEVALA